MWQRRTSQRRGWQRDERAAKEDVVEQNDTFEYAIRKDVRNNPIVREVDEERHRELWQSVGIGVVLVLVLLFSAWQHFELLRHGYRLEQMQRERASEAGDQPAPAPRDRDPERGPADREAGHPAARHGEARRRRCRDSRAGEPVAGAGLVGRGGAMIPLQVTPVSQPTASGWRAQITSRYTVLASGVRLLWSVGIVARLVFLQVLSHDEMVLIAESQSTRVIEAPAKRGEIYDRNGRLLAFSVDADSMYAVPAEVGDAPAAAAELCGALADCDQEGARQRSPSGSAVATARSCT